MSRFRFSANTGFLWRELPFAQRIEKAGAHGFNAVEFHDEAQSADLIEVSDKLQEYRLAVVCLNTAMGPTAGNAAVPGQELQARTDIDAATRVADQLGAGAIHVVAGMASGSDAMDSYLANLSHALESTDKTILIEPISQAGIPGYFLNSSDQARQVLRILSHPRLKMMFDCFHMRHETSDLESRFNEMSGDIGHIQISSFPERSEPCDGTIRYSTLLNRLVALGYRGYFGCEYAPENTVESGLGWREAFSHNGY